MNNRTALRTTGKAGLSAGFGLIPINRETKRPLFRQLPLLYGDGVPVMRQHVDKVTGEVSEFHARGWKPYQQQLATLADIDRWVDAGAQLAVVCGAVSSGLLILDFDVPGFFGRWYRRAARAGLPVGALVIQRTGGGGWQVLICCDAPGENTKLAWVKDDGAKSGRAVAIETRGEGGYAVIAPSVHPSGNYYRWRHGDLQSVHHWDMADVASLLSIARDLSEVMDEAPQFSVPRGEHRTGLAESDRVIDEYNRRTDITHELSRAGYTPAPGGRWHRPGYERTSEPSVELLDNRSWHWSSNDPLSNGFWKTPFAIRLYFDFSGDLKSAVRTIAAELNMSFQPRTSRLDRARAFLALSTSHKGA